MNHEARHEVLVLGGGPAGAAAACRLARQGIPTLLLERDTAPRHKVCGEFISVEAQKYLGELGLDFQALGAARIGKIRVVAGSGTVEADLPFEGFGLTRRVLDEALLHKAEAGGASVRRGVVVRSVVPNGPAFEVRLRAEPGLQARTVFLATGKYDLNERKRPLGASGSDLIGFKTYFMLSPPQLAKLRGRIEIVLFDGGYAGLQCVEGGLVNLCLLVNRTVFEAIGRSWARLLEHLMRESLHLRQRLGAADAILEKPLTIANVPYGFVHRPGPAETKGLYRLGDQMGVIPSFCGDGIAIALHTARMAVDSYADGREAAAEYHARAGADISGPIRLACGLYHLSRLRVGRRALLTACRLYPGILGVLATRTRMPEPAGAAQVDTRLCTAE
jgi:flavin-dependent dehydrogenase